MTVGVYPSTGDGIIQFNIVRNICFAIDLLPYERYWIGPGFFVQCVYRRDRENPGQSFPRRANLFPATAEKSKFRKSVMKVLFLSQILTGLFLVQSTVPTLLLNRSSIILRWRFRRIRRNFFFFQSYIKLFIDSRHYAFRQFSCGYNNNRIYIPFQPDSDCLLRPTA